MDEALRLEVCCGGVLLSHNLSVAVPLALPGLASRFGMEAGRFPGAMTTTRIGVQHAPPRCGGCGLIVVCIVVAAFVAWFLVTHNECGWLFSVGPLVPVGSRAHYCASTSGLSTRSSGGGLSPHGGRGNLILKQASRLDAFSGYPFRT